MAARLPLWLREAARTFNLEKKNWYQEEFLPLIEKRNGFRSAECGQAPLSACTIQSTLVQLKLFLLRHHGSKLISAEFNDWLQSQSPASESYDAKLLALIREQKDNPMGLLKLQRDMAARLKKVPKKVNHHRSTVYWLATLDAGDVGAHGACFSAGPKKKIQGA